MNFLNDCTTVCSISRITKVLRCKVTFYINVYCMFDLIFFALLKNIQTHFNTTLKKLNMLKAYLIMPEYENLHSISNQNKLDSYSSIQAVFFTEFLIQYFLLYYQLASNYMLTYIKSNIIPPLFPCYT